MKHRLAVVLALLLAVTGQSLAGQKMVAPVASAAASTTDSPGTRFDKRFREVDSIEFVIDGPKKRQQVLKELQALVPPGDVHRTRMYQSMRCVLDFDKDHDGGLAFAKAHLAEAEAANDLVPVARFRLCLTSFMELKGASPTETLPIYQAAIDAAAKTADPDLLGYTHSFRGDVYSMKGDQALALLDYLDAQHIFEQADLKTDAEANLFKIAIAYRRMGELNKAMEYFNQQEVIAKAKHKDDDLISIYSNYGYIHEEKGEFDAAENDFKRAIELSKRKNSRSSIGSSRLALASILVQTKRYSTALRTLQQARTDLLVDGPIDFSNQALLALYSGQAKAGLGQHREALEDYASADAALDSSENLRYQAMLYKARSESFEALSDNAGALAELKRYLVTQQALTDKTRSEQTLFLQHQFDASRRDLENQRLNAEKLLREQELESLIKARRWQWAAIALAAVLLVLLSVLVARQILRMRRLQVLALTDSLTGLANRRRIERFANEQIEQSLAQKRSFTIITLDIDYFKRLNDTYGHIAGDQVLARVATACQQALRAFDVIGRTGGEEFLVVLPRSQLAQGAQVAERLRASVAELDLNDIAPGLKVTVSMGVAEFKSEDRDLKDLVRRADNALYRAKANGRDRIEVEP